MLLLLKSYHLDEGNILIKTVAQQNWNAEWESSFEPVCIGSELRVRAPFHLADASFPIELIIQPKTSFGTGHHETTFTIMELMLNMDMKDKQVFDYGSGTGILAILASKLGSNRIFANDIDTWAAENIFENISLNQAKGIEFINGDLSIVPAQEFDVILANINKNILLTSFIGLRPLLKKGGTIFISGFYESDLPDLMLEANKCGFKLINQVTRNQWTAAEFTC
jgi:ribosomal protein L11 methyltransferase